MKRKYIVILLIGVALISVLCAFLFPHNYKAVGSFRLEDCEEYIIKFESNITVGKIRNAKDAAQAAAELFSQVLAIEETEYRPYLVFYDSENDAWKVIGNISVEQNEWVFGPAPCAIIQSDGDVLAVFVG